MDRWFTLLSKIPAWTTFEQNASRFTKQHLWVRSVSSSSTGGQQSADQGQENDKAEPPPWRPGKAGKWTPRGRRASLSPSARLFAAMNEEPCRSDQTTEQCNKENLAGSDSDSKLCSTIVHSATTHGDTDRQSQLPNEESGDYSELPHHSDVSRVEKLQKQYDSNPHLKRRNLSPLKRFSDMIPENYWNESKDGSSVKQDLDSLIKSDESVKK